MEENTAMCAPATVYNQGIFNTMELPINSDYIAIAMAVRDLLKEGWRFETICKKEEGLLKQENYFIQLSREWKC